MCVCVWGGGLCWIVLHTCEEGMVVQTPLLVLMRAHVKQVRLDWSVDKIR